MKITLVLFSFFITLDSAHALISVKQCLVFDDYVAHKLTAEKVCTQGGGSYCNSGKPDAEIICSGLGGNFCGNQQNIAQSYCMIIGGNYCSKVEATEVDTWQAKVQIKCREMIKALETKLEKTTS